VPRRLALALVLPLLVLVHPAQAAEGEAPVVGTPAITPNNAVEVRVSVPVDTNNAETLVQLEYVTAGAYRRVPGAATTVTIGTIAASADGPLPVVATVAGLEPASSYRMRVRASNAGGETFSPEVAVRTPAAPRAAFRARVGKNATALTMLQVKGLRAEETIEVTCRTRPRGCPFTTRTIGAPKPGRLRLTSLFAGAALAPGTKVTVRVVFGTERLSTLTLVVRDDRQPKVRRS
jgi:hypothetical protein